MSAAEQVGKTANVLIFLGVLYTVLSLVGLLRVGLSWSVLATLGGGVSGIALGYGIRYGNMLCLYVAAACCAILVSYFGYRTIGAPAWQPAVRLGLSGWALWRLLQAIPAMQILRRTHTRPLATSRYGEFFLRRKAPAPGVHQGSDRAV